MAEIEKTEFTFPDEKEQAEEKASADNTEFEVIDDTPPEDRGRKPMAEPPKEITDDELSKYDEGVQKRIKHFSKGYHEERRAKETAQREKEEAIRLAQTILAENNQLKGSVNQNQAALLEQAKRVVISEVDDAKRLYKEAYESGDSDKLVEAQEALTNAKIRADKVNNFRHTPLQVQETPVQTTPQQAQPAPVDNKLLAWQDENQWFGKNRRMTSYALGLHEDLLEEGIPAGSDEYYRRINADVKERFPEELGAGGSVDAKPQRTKSNIVAPATRSTAPRKIVLTQTQVNLAKRLGVSLESYAREVAKEMRK
jgi:hypothetical protein